MSSMAREALLEDRVRDMQSREEDLRSACAELRREARVATEAAAAAANQAATAAAASSSRTCDKAAVAAGAVKTSLPLTSRIPGVLIVASASIFHFSSYFFLFSS